MPQRILAMIAALSLLCCALVAAQPQPVQAKAISPQVCTRTIKIMPLGDSITKGTGSGIKPYDNDYQVGYRQILDQNLLDLGYTVSFLGSLDSGRLAVPKFSSIYNRFHEGHGGYSSRDLLLGKPAGSAENLTKWLTADPADIILLHIGTNDPSQVAETGQILDTIRAIEPNVTVIMAKIINLKSFSRYGKQGSDFNQSIAQLVTNRADAAKIVLVDQEAALSYPQDLYDDVHPTDAGYAKMAAVWFKALQNVIPTLCAGAASRASTPAPAPTAPASTAPTNNRAAALALFDTASSTPQRSTRASDATAPTNNRAAALALFDTASSTPQRSTRASNQPPGIGCFSNLIGYWRLDENDLLATGHNFRDTCAGNDAVTSYFDPSPGAGQVSGGQRFTSSGANTPTEVDIPGNVRYNWAAAESFSIGFWMKGVRGTTCAKGDQAMVARYLGDYTNGNPNARWLIGCAEGGQAIFQLGDQTGDTLTIRGPAINDGAWHYIVAVRDGTAGTNQLYVDGALAVAGNKVYSASFASKPVSASVITPLPQAPITLGWFDASTDTTQQRVFDGTLDELSIFNTALTTAQVQQFYTLGQSGQPLPLTPPTTYLPLMQQQ